MRYLLLVYEDERRAGGLPPGERRALAQACYDSDEALRQSGYLLAAESLEECGGAVIVWWQGATLSVTDGPPGPAGARLRSVVTLQARDLNEAIQIAATMPQARLGPIEVRPLAG
jgi:hypothetical protein